MTIKIKGMHCPACVMLIKMELEENNLADLIDELKIIEGENYGELNLSEDIDDETNNKIKNIINSLDQYSVI